MAFIRKKSVTLDGVTVILGSVLSCEAESLISKQREIIDQADVQPIDKLKALGETWEHFLVDSLNRGGSKTPEGATWDTKNIHEQFDKGCLAWLKDQAMDMNGIGLRKGEATAPSTSPS